MEQVMMVMVPFPAQGHLNQLLHFSVLLSARGLPVRFACTASHIRQAKARIEGRDPQSLENIGFDPLPLAPFPTPPPDPSANFPSHLLPSFEAAMELRAPLSSLFRSLSRRCRRLVVVFDPMMSFVSSDVAALPNGESYRFQCVPSYIELHYFCQGPPCDDSSALPPQVRDVILDPFAGCLTPEFLDFILRNHVDAAAETGTLFNSSRSIEGEFLDLLGGVPRYHGKKIFAVGPLHPLRVDGCRGDILEWLDAQPPASVLYVSFGTTTTLPDEQVERLAIGLERSGHRFVWVLRGADLGDIFVDEMGSSGSPPRRKLPPGFEERTEGRGTVVRGWAPQLAILAHPSTGGFVSHCGWNSCIESLSNGVPMVAWPMHSDQPRNAAVVTGYLKVGVAVREWARHGELVSAEAIEESIKKVMEGEEIRKRARLLGEAIRLSVEEGGTSRADLDSFIHHVTRENAVHQDKQEFL